MNIGYAIFIQAILFYLVHIPQMYAVYWGGTQPIAYLTFLLTPTAGLIGGYVWYKTRNLPMLVLYHITINPHLPLIYFFDHL